MFVSLNLKSQNKTNIMDKQCDIEKLEKKNYVTFGRKYKKTPPRPGYLSFSLRTSPQQKKKRKTRERKGKKRDKEQNIKGMFRIW